MCVVMKINMDRVKSLIWVIPAVIAFILALMPTLIYQWPISWDVIYHIQYAQIYANYGFVLNDPLLNVPYGQKIGYPPLFHFLIVALGLLFKTDFFQIARFLQPFIVLSIVLSVSYVARKFYGTIAGISAGFFIISSLLLGNRLIFPLPENLALIFLPLSVYFYYNSIIEKSIKYAVLAGSLLIIILSIHTAATFILFLLICAFTLVELIFYRNKSVLRNLGAFLIIPAIIFIMGILFLLVVYPNIIYNILDSGIKNATGFATSLSYSIHLGLSSYGNLGWLGLIFALVGIIVMLKRRSKKDIFLLSWMAVILLILNASLFGINVISYRLLVYLLIPLSIIGGFGISWIYHKLEDYKNFSSKNFRTAFLVSIFALATFNGILTMENPLISSFEIENQYGTFQIAPPTSSELDLANWFNANGDKSKSIMSNDLFPCTFLITQTNMSLTSDLSFENFNNTTPESYFKENNIGYIVLDKRLSFNASNGTLYKVKMDAEFYRIFYYSQNIHSNIDQIFPNYIKVVYENDVFIVGKIQ